MPFSIPDAETLSNALDPAQAKADIAEAVLFLIERAGGANGHLPLRILCHKKPIDSLLLNHSLEGIGTAGELTDEDAV